MYRAVLFLLALLVSACASGSGGQTSTGYMGCSRSGVITVYVVNRSFSDVRMTFGSEQRLERAHAQRTTVYSGVPRYQVIRGASWRVVTGLDRGMRPIEGTDPTCNEATLFVNPGAMAGIMFGADLRGRRDR